MSMSPDKRLERLAVLFLQRNAAYGASYLSHGKVMQALFPEGVTLRTEADHVRWGLLTEAVGKLGRYTARWDAGGHGHQPDSLDDLSVYAQMLAFADELKRSGMMATMTHLSSLEADRDTS